MKTLSDTTPEAEKIQIDILRQMPIARKLQLMEDLNQMARRLALRQLRQQHPHAADAELFRRLADRLLGPALAANVYDPLPTAAGGAQESDDR